MNNNYNLINIKIINLIYNLQSLEILGKKYSINYLTTFEIIFIKYLNIILFISSKRIYY